MLFRKTRALPFCYTAIRLVPFRVRRALASSLSTAQCWRIPLGRRKSAPRPARRTDRAIHQLGVWRQAAVASISLTGFDGLCGKTRKMTGPENLDFTRRTSSARVIATTRRMGGPHAARSPARPNPCRIFLQGRYCGLNCDRREKSSFST
jgi:hypothetical protein